MEYFFKDYAYFHAGCCKFGDFYVLVVECDCQQYISKSSVQVVSTEVSSLQEVLDQVDEGFLDRDRNKTTEELNQIRLFAVRSKQ